MPCFLYALSNVSDEWFEKVKTMNFEDFKDYSYEDALEFGKLNNLNIIYDQPDKVEIV